MDAVEVAAAAVDTVAATAVFSEAEEVDHRHRHRRLIIHRNITHHHRRRHIRVC